MNKLITLSLKLNPKQKRFAELIAKGKKQVEAYIEAGYKTDSMKHKTIESAARRCMGNVSVKTYYSALQYESTERALNVISYTKQDWLRNELSILSLAMGDKPTKMSAVFQGEYFQAELKSVDLSAALKAQEQLGKVLALFVDKKSVDGSITINNLIADISKEAAESPNDSPLPKDHIFPLS
jgi:phage terminase small subunit